jgi:hypothetical protein
MNPQREKRKWYKCLRLRGSGFSLVATRHPNQELKNWARKAPQAIIIFQKHEARLYTYTLTLNACVRGWPTLPFFPVKPGAPPFVIFNGGVRFRYDRKCEGGGYENPPLLQEL